MFYCEFIELSIPMLLLISKGYSSQVRGKCRQAPRLLGGGGGKQAPTARISMPGGDVSPRKTLGNTVSS